MTAFGTPRRLAVHITDVARRSADQPFKQKLMPLAVARDAARNWTQAFLKKLEGLGRGHLAALPVGSSEGPDSLIVESDGKAESIYLHSIAAGQNLHVALQAALDETLAGLPIPKMMSYQLADGVTTVQFVRPAHRLVALHGHEVVPVHALGLSAGTKTQGHRFMCKGEIALRSADTYVEQMQDEGRVIPSFAARRARIEEQLTRAAAPLGASVIAPDELLEEVTALVEWPSVYESGFEPEFLQVPQECLILTMQQNQKYFALKDARRRADRPLPAGVQPRGQQPRGDHRRQRAGRAGAARRCEVLLRPGPQADAGEPCHGPGECRLPQQARVAARARRARDRHRGRNRARAWAGRHRTSNARRGWRRRTCAR